MGCVSSKPQATQVYRRWLRGFSSLLLRQPHSEQRRVGFPDTMRRCELFNFVLPNGLLARRLVADVGFHELAVYAASNPKGDRVRALSAGSEAGDVFVSTWVERERGA